MINVLNTYSTRYKSLLYDHINKSVKELYGIDYKGSVSFLAYNYCLLYGLELYLLDNTIYTQAELLKIISALSIKNCCGTVQLITPSALTDSCCTKKPTPVYFTGTAINLDTEDPDYLKWFHEAYAGNTSFMLALDGVRFLVPWVEFVYLPEGGVRFTGFVPAAGNIFVAIP